MAVWVLWQLQLHIYACAAQARPTNSTTCIRPFRDLSRLVIYFRFPLRMRFTLLLAAMVTQAEAISPIALISK